MRSRAPLRESTRLIPRVGLALDKKIDDFAKEAGSQAALAARSQVRAEKKTAESPIRRKGAGTHDGAHAELEPASERSAYLLSGFIVNSGRWGVFFHGSDAVVSSLGVS